MESLRWDGVTFKLSEDKDLDRKLLAYAAMERAISSAESDILNDLGDFESVRDGMWEALDDYYD